MQMRGAPLTTYALPVLAAVGLAGLTGVAFAMWLDNKGAIFMSLVESGLSWCF